MGDIEFIGRKLIDFPDLGEVFFLFGINFFFLFLIIKVVYMNTTKKREHVFTLFIFNIVIFFLCIMLSSVKLKMGFAFGLFAILSILRYRTETVPIKEMTFLFISITIGVINSLVSKKVSITEILATNVIIFAATYIIEWKWLRKYALSQSVKYERIELIGLSKRDELVADLTNRLGVHVTDVDVERIDFLTDTAILTVYYNADEK